MSSLLTFGHLAILALTLLGIQAKVATGPAPTLPLVAVVGIALFCSLTRTFIFQSLTFSLHTLPAVAVISGLAGKSVEPRPAPSPGGFYS